MTDFASFQSELDALLQQPTIILHTLDSLAESELKNLLCDKQLDSLHAALLEGAQPYVIKLGELSRTFHQQITTTSEFKMIHFDAFEILRLLHPEQRFRSERAQDTANLKLFEEWRAEFLEWRFTLGIVKAMIDKHPDAVCASFGCTLRPLKHNS